jgi:hypothetical protein
MADLDDDARHGSPDTPPRRQPPTIEAEAVELPIDGTPGGTGSAAGGSEGAATTRRAGFARGVIARWWLVTALAGAAIVAGAVAWLVIAGGDRDDLQVRVTRLEAQQRDDAARIQADTVEPAKLEDLASRLARLEAAAAARPTVPDNGPRLAAVEAAEKSIAARLDELDRRSRDLAAAASNAGERADAVAGELAELKKGSLPTVVAAPGDRAALDELTNRLTALEVGLKATREQLAKSATAPTAAAVTTDAPLRAALVTVSLRMTVERGVPFAVELAAARKLSLDPKALTALEPFAATGVPSANALFRELSTLAPELSQASTPAANDGTYLQRLQASAERLVRIRPVGAASPDDTTGSIGRIELAITRRDVDSAVAELDKLPATARALALAWRTKALGRQAALDAARDLATQSLARLGDAPAPQ